jgi:hypothetical protein
MQVEPQDVGPQLVWVNHKPQRQTASAVVLSVHRTDGSETHYAAGYYEGAPIVTPQALLYAIDERMSAMDAYLADLFW